MQSERKSINTKRRRGKWDELANKAKDPAKYNVSEWKVWSLIRKKKDDGPLPSKADELRAYAKRMEGRDPLTAKECLLDLGHGEELVDFVLEGRDDEVVEGGDPDAEEDGSNEDDRDEPHDGEEDDMSSSS